jgi:hypothetical protein
MKARMADLTLNDYVIELRADANLLENIVEEVEQYIADGNLHEAALVLANQTAKIGLFTEAYGSLQKRLQAEGADPERARSPD